MAHRCDAGALGLFGDTCKSKHIMAQTSLPQFVGEGNEVLRDYNDIHKSAQEVMDKMTNLNLTLPTGGLNILSD